MGIWQWLYHGLIRLWRRLVSRNHSLRQRRGRPFWLTRAAIPPRKVLAPPKPKWVKQEVIRLKTLMPEAGCRTLAHHFNRRWKARKQMTIGHAEHPL